MEKKDLKEVFQASFLQNFDSKERSVNFTKNEITKLQMLVDKYKHILMCKKTDATSAKQKEHAWNIIHTQFNATGQIPRTIKQLKYKFENMKRNAKKEATRERQEIIRTGGGKPMVPPPGSEDATDWLRSVMSASIDGNEAIYDDDILTNPVSLQRAEELVIINTDDEELNPIQKEPKLPASEHSFTLNDVEIADITVIETENTRFEKIGAFDCSTPHSSLKRPISEPLKKQIIKKKAIAGENVIKKALREQKISILRDLNAFEMEKIKQSIQHQRELHQQMMRHNEEKHELEKIKLQLEVDILKSKLNIVNE